MFASLSDRLTSTFKTLRGKGRLSPADVDATVRQIRLALLDADVSLPVVRAFTAAVRERALGDEVSRALNPGQQVVKIVNEELVAILGGQSRTAPAGQEPADGDHAGRACRAPGKTTLAGKLGHWLKEQGHAPRPGGLRPPAAQRGHPAAGQRRARRGRGVRPRARQRRRGPGRRGPPRRRARAVPRLRRRRRRHRRTPRRRRRPHAAGLGHPRRRAARRGALRPGRHDRPVRGRHGQAVRRRRLAHRRRHDQARRRRPRWCGAVGGHRDRQPDPLRLHGREAHRLRGLPPRPHGRPDPRHGRRAHPHRAGREGVRRRADRQDGGQAASGATTSP